MNLPVDLQHELWALGDAYLRLALSVSGGNGAEAARLLGLNYRQFRYLLDKMKAMDKAAVPAPGEIP